MRHQVPWNLYTFFSEVKPMDEDESFYIDFSTDKPHLRSFSRVNTKPYYSPVQFVPSTPEFHRTEGSSQSSSQSPSEIQWSSQEYCNTDGSSQRSSSESNNADLSYLMSELYSTKGSSNRNYVKSEPRHSKHPDQLKKEKQPLLSYPYGDINSTPGLGIDKTHDCSYTDSIQNSQNIGDSNQGFGSNVIESDDSPSQKKCNLESRPKLRSPCIKTVDPVRIQENMRSGFSFYTTNRCYLESQSDTGLEKGKLFFNLNSSKNMSETILNSKTCYQPLPSCTLTSNNSGRMKWKIYESDEGDDDDFLNFDESFSLPCKERPGQSDDHGIRHEDKNFDVSNDLKFRLDDKFGISNDQRFRHCLRKSNTNFDITGVSNDPDEDSSVGSIILNPKMETPMTERISLENKPVTNRLFVKSHNLDTAVSFKQPPKYTEHMNENFNLQNNSQCNIISDMRTCNQAIDMNSIITRDNGFKHHFTKSTCSQLGFGKLKNPTDKVKSSETLSNLVKSSTKRIAQSEDQDCVPRRKQFRCPLPKLTACILKGSQRNLGSELQFPSLQEITDNSLPTRELEIPVEFFSISMYKQIFSSVLREHLNIILFDLGIRYHHALSKMDLSTYLPLMTGKENKGPVNSNPVCKCGAPSKMIQVKKSGPNQNRFFYACNAVRNSQCKFFQWADDTRNHHTKQGTGKIAMSDSASVTTFIRGHHLQFYCDCIFIRRCTESIVNHFKRNVPNWVKQKMGIDTTSKKRMYIQLSRKDNSTLFSKDDLWVVSRSLDFGPTSTILCKSTYYGPTAGNEVEIEPISSFCPSNWSNEVKCHAILAGNVSSELSYLTNLEENLSPTDVPVLTSLLNSDTEITMPSLSGRNPESICIPESSVESKVEELINQYKLNDDQSAALLRVSRMFTNSTNSIIMLIHGVFGAGKSFLLSVIVLFLVWLFEENELYSTDVKFSWKLVIASTTNVAVDRILNGLLALGFEDFVRVGSVKKIAKPVLPFSVHATGSDSQELKDLQMMLRSDELTVSEKQHVRQSIENHKLGENRKKLSKVRVVGVTCASCSSPSLKDMKFPVVLLDECSQMTEPASMLPVAKFRCQKLLLVGDPKQLDPTIQGSEASTESGLEQTMFDRLVKMGHNPVMLHTQYRCHPHISHLSNALFYNNELKDGVEYSDRQPLMEDLPALCFFDVTLGYEQGDSSGSFYNDKEAEFIVYMIEVLISHNVDAERIGVISLYKSQMNKINILLGMNKLLKEMKGVLVSTVDAYQGGERDVILLSCVRTKHFGFIDNEKRINVALSRARHHLLIVGNVNNLTKNKLWNQIIQLCKDTSSHGLQKAEDVMKKLDAQHKEHNKPKKNNLEVSNPSDDAVSPPMSFTGGINWTGVMAEG